MKVAPHRVADVGEDQTSCPLLGLLSGSVPTSHGHRVQGQTGVPLTGQQGPSTSPWGPQATKRERRHPPTSLQGCSVYRPYTNCCPQSLQKWMILCLIKLQHFLQVLLPMD